MENNRQGRQLDKEFDVIASFELIFTMQLILLLQNCKDYLYIVCLINLTF